MLKATPPSTKWFLVVRDGTIVFESNIRCALSLFDHNAWWYMGGVTENKLIAEQFGADMAYANAGIVVSRALAEHLSKDSLQCVYQIQPGSMFADQFLRKCLGLIAPDVRLHALRGMHQMEMWGDVAGFIEGYASRFLPLTLANAEVTSFLDGAPRFGVIRKYSALAQGIPQRFLFQRVHLVQNDGLVWSLCFGYSIVVSERATFDRTDHALVERTWSNIGNVSSVNDTYYLVDDSVGLRPASHDAQVRYIIQYANATHQFFSVREEMISHPLVAKRALPPWAVLQVAVMAVCESASMQLVDLDSVHVVLAISVCLHHPLDEYPSTAPRHPSPSLP